MAENAPTPQLTPYVYYEDVAAALDWLAKTFGFRERLRMTDPGGEITHAEMELGDAVIMMGCPSPDYRNPKRLGEVALGLYVQVADVDRHFEHAKATGATIQGEPQDQPYGDRNYGALDLEGHQWWFAQRLRDVTPQEMEANYG